MAHAASTVFILVFLPAILASTSTIPKDSPYSKAVIESCSGCKLNRLTDVKQFIFEDVPNYDRVSFKHIQGASPELVLYDHHNEVMERLELSVLTREECNNLLRDKGFQRNLKPAKDEI